jgi:hypothetical protein
MMNHTHAPALQAAASAYIAPLLDDGFDPDEEEIFEHNELYPLHAHHHEEEEFSA